MAAGNAVMTALFTTMALIQYNDPDPLLWITAYGLSALCCALFLVGYRSVFFPGIIAVGCGLGTVYLLLRALGPVGIMDKSGQEMMGLTEVFRETLGLLICTSWVGFLSWWSSTDRSSDIAAR